MKKIILFAFITLCFGCKTKSKVGQPPTTSTGATATCVDTENPFTVGWMDKAIDLHNPTQVVKYRDAERWKYLFRGLPSSYLYDCEGKLICETKNDHDDCHENDLAVLGRGKIIWQGEGVWD